MRINGTNEVSLNTNQTTRQTELQHDNQFQREGDFDEAFRATGIVGQSMVKHTPKLSENELLAKKIFNPEIEDISNDDVNVLLKELGYTPDEINKYRKTLNDDKLMNKLVFVLYNVSANDTSIREQAKNLLYYSLENYNGESESTLKFLNILKIVNEENIQLLMSKTNERNEAVDILNSLIPLALDKDTTYAEKILAQSMDLSEISAGTQSIKKLIQELSKIEDYELYTKERVLAHKNLCEALGEEEWIVNAKYIDNPKDITPEFIEEYKDVIEKVKKQNIETIYDKAYNRESYATPIDENFYNPIFALKEYKDILEKLDKSGLDFSWYINSTSGNKHTLSIDKVKEILNGGNLEEKSELLSKLEPKTKEKYEHVIINALKNEKCLNDVDGFSKLMNKVTEIPVILYDILSYCTGDVDFNEVAKVAQAFVDIGDYPGGRISYPLIAHDINKVHNYDGAVKLIKELKNFYESDGSKYTLKEYMNEPWRSMDYSTATDKFKALKEHGLYGKVSPRNLRHLLETSDIKVLNQILEFNEHPIYQDNAAYLFSDFDDEFLKKKFNEFCDTIKELNPELNQFSAKEIIQILKGVNIYVAGTLYNTLKTNCDYDKEKLQVTKQINPDTIEMAKILFVEKEGKFDKRTANDILRTFQSYVKGDNTQKDEFYNYTLKLLKSDLPKENILNKIRIQISNDKDSLLIDELFLDAFANRDLLKSGLEDLSDEELQSTIYDSKTLKTLRLIGKGNIEAAFPMTIEGFEDVCEELSEFEYKVLADNKEALLQKINPTESKKYKAMTAMVTDLKKQLNSVLGDEASTKIKEFQAEKAIIDNDLTTVQSVLKSTEPNSPEYSELKYKFKDLQKQSKILGGKIQTLYMTSGDSETVKKIMGEIKLKNKEINDFVKEYSDLNPQDVIDKTRVIAVINKYDPSLTRNFIDLLKPSTPENDSTWNTETNKVINEMLGTDVDEITSQKLDLLHCKYLSKLAVSLLNKGSRSDSELSFKEYMQKLVNLLNENPDLTVEDSIDSLPQNQVTKEKFKEIGIDYESWTKVNPESYSSIQVMLSAEESQKAAINSLEDDLNNPLFKKLPQEIQDELINGLKEIGVTLKKSKKENFDDNGFSVGSVEYYRLYKDGQPIQFKEMKKIISKLKEVINSNQFWSTKNINPEVELARSDMYEHIIKLRKTQVNIAKGLKENETVNLKVSKTNMYDIKKALGLGNDGQCCTALGALFNEYSAPTYIMNKCIGAIELTDNSNFVGNTMMYIANVDGEPALVLDNVELKSKYQKNDAIRDTFINYAQKVCEEIGKPNLPIYAGPHRHKLDFDIFPKSEHKMQIIGSTGQDEIYLDYDASAHIIDNEEGNNVTLYKIR